MKKNSCFLCPFQKYGESAIKHLNAYGMPAFSLQPTFMKKAQNCFPSCLAKLQAFFCIKPSEAVKQKHLPVMHLQNLSVLKQHFLLILPTVTLRRLPSWICVIPSCSACFVKKFQAVLSW